VFSVDAKPDLNLTKPAQARTSVLNAPASRSEPSPFAPASASAAATGVSVIGTDLTLLGEKITIISQNKLQVDGDVRGNVHGKQVIITTDGSVVGLVCAEKIEVQGGVRGSIRAVNVTLHASAQVEGDIMHHTLAISEGAQFEGRVRRSNNIEELMPVLDPEAIASGGHSGDAGLG
jgi:cytoskeletal protein CcmA (bactofilin family)